MYKKIISAAVTAVMSMNAFGAYCSHAVYESDSPFKSTFIQGWLCRDWTAERWEEEFSAMKDAGFESLIIQSVCDLTYEQADTSESTQNHESYSLSSAYTLYPSDIEELSGAYVSSQNSGDALGLAFEAAKSADMQIYIGLVSDDRWWNYGWGLPQTDTEGNPYFSDWCDINGSISADVITEIWERYGEEYGDYIAGWYYVNEIWNIDTACAGTDSGYYAEAIGENINYTINAINEVSPDKPLLISPFFNDTISTAEQYGKFWKDIFSCADFREGDIFAHQDGSGGEREPSVIREWALALKSAVETENGMLFQINNETFQTDYSSKPVDELRANIEATADLADERILFSWNHYYNPLVNSEFTSLNEEFKALAQELSAKKYDPLTDKCYIYIGTYGDENYPLFRYYDPEYTRLTHIKVYLPYEYDGELEYGDVLVSDDTHESSIEGTVRRITNDIKLTKIGTCSEFFETETLTVSGKRDIDMPFDGTADSSDDSLYYTEYDFVLTNENDNVYSYSCDFYNISDTIFFDKARPRDTAVFAVVNGRAVLPLDEPVHIPDIMGDVNEDREFSIADIVLMHSYMLDCTDTVISDPKAGDFCADEVIDVFDIALMRSALVEEYNRPSRTLTVTTTYGGSGVDGQDLGSGTFTESFRVCEGDTFYETDDGHWLKNSCNTMEYISEIAEIVSFGESGVTVSFTDENGNKTEAAVGYNTDYGVASTFTVYDGINYEYSILFT